MSQDSRSVDQVSVGEELPELSIDVSTTTVIGGAFASRDLTPLHHDKAADSFLVHLDRGVENRCAGVDGDHITVLLLQQIANGGHGSFPLLSGLQDVPQYSGKSADVTRKFGFSAIGDSHSTSTKQRVGRWTDVAPS